MNNLAQNINDDTVFVKIYETNGFEGPGFYLFEEDYEDEGYLWFGDHYPTEEEIKAICPEYVDSKWNK